MQTTSIHIVESLYGMHVHFKSLMRFCALMWSKISFEDWNKANLSVSFYTVS